MKFVRTGQFKSDYSVTTTEDGFTVAYGRVWMRRGIWRWRCYFADFSPFGHKTRRAAADELRDHYRKEHQ